MTVGASLAWPVLLPLAGAMVAAVGSGRVGRIAGLATAVLVPPAAGAVVAGVWRVGPVRHPLGGWGAPLGIELHADGLAALMLATSAVVGAVTALYASAYFEARHERAFWPLFLFLWAGLNALFLSDDVFNLYVTLELLGLAAVALVALAGTRAAVTGAMRYLVFSLAGSFFYLLGVALLYASFGALSLTTLAEVASPGPPLWAALIAMTVGLFMKTAVVPLHAWLPPAHSNAPSPASALLSALVVKGSFFIVVRLWLGFFPLGAEPPGVDPLGPPPGGMLVALGAFGAAAVLWGSVLALRQRRIKLLVAYSTVGQIGYLLIMFPLLGGGGPEAGGPGAAEAWNGGIYHLVSHACAKAAMFLAAGSMARAAGGDDLPSLTGIGHRLPLSFTAFGLGGLTLTGMPPSGGFIAKWLLLSAAIGAGRWIWVAVIVTGSLLAAGYVFKVLRHAFRAADPEAAAPPAIAPVPLRMEVAALGLGLIAVLLGIWAAAPLALLGAGGFPFSP